MKYEKTAIRDVVNEFENNSRQTLIEEISKMRKMMNNFSYNIHNAITDIQRPGSDCSIALSHLLGSLENAIDTNNSKYFNISKFKEQQQAKVKYPLDGKGILLHDQDRVYTHYGDKLRHRRYGSLYHNEDLPEMLEWAIEFDDDATKTPVIVKDFNTVFKA